MRVAAGAYSKLTIVPCLAMMFARKALGGISVSPSRETIPIGRRGREARAQKFQQERPVLVARR